MTGEDFYEEFKNALASIGLRWGEMDKADVRRVGEYIVLSFCDRTASFRVPAKTSETIR